MGWRTDWLYQLIFAEVTRIWTGARWQGTQGRYGPPPDFLLIEECADANWFFPGCLGTVSRAWIYHGTDFEVRSPKEDEPQASQVPGSMFYTRGVVRFHVRADRKKVVLDYALGPRYGRGMVLLVRGQGKRGRLEADPDSRQWTS